MKLIFAVLSLALVLGSLSQVEARGGKIPRQEPLSSGATFPMSAEDETRADAIRFVQSNAEQWGGLNCRSGRVQRVSKIESHPYKYPSQICQGALGSDCYIQTENWWKASATYRCL